MSVLRFDATGLNPRRILRDGEAPDGTCTKPEPATKRDDGTEADDPIAAARARRDARNRNARDGMRRS